MDPSSAETQGGDPACWAHLFDDPDQVGDEDPAAGATGGVLGAEGASRDRAPGPGGVPPGARGKPARSLAAEKPAHPTLRAALLMISVVVLIVVLALVSALGQS